MMSVTKWKKGRVRTYRNETNTSVVAEPVHLTLFLAVEQIVVVLHADELGPAVLLSGKLHPRKLDSPHGAGTNVVHLAALDQVMQCLHRLLDWSVVVESVDLQEIDVVGIEALQGGIDLVEDGLARQTALVGVVSELWKLRAILDCSQTWVLARVSVAFGEDDELMAGKFVLLDRLANDLFRDSVGVYVGCDFHVSDRGN